MTTIHETQVTHQEIGVQTLSEDAESQSASSDVSENEQQGSIVSAPDSWGPNVKDMTVEALEKIKSELSTQCEKIKSELWSRQAMQKVLQKRKRQVRMPLRKKYKVDRILQRNQTTKSTFEELSRETDNASQEARQMYTKRMEQEQKIMALRAELVHNQRLIAVHNERNKTIRAQIATSRTQFKKMQIMERAAIKKNKDMNQKYKKVRRVLKKQVLRDRTAMQLARKQAELDKIKNIARELESQAPVIHGPITGV